jgi:hypothetical protein
MPMPIKLRGLVSLAAVLCGLAAPSQAQPATEQLIAPIPPTFKLAGRVPHDGAKVQVFLPANETIENWSEEIVVIVYPNKGSLSDPMAILRSIEKTWIEACKESKPISILPGKSNGYATATMLVQCPLLAVTGKPEAGLVHAIKGNDNLYIIQKNARYLPTHDQVKEMVRYMGTVRVCDSRAPDHPCPNPTGQGAKQ